MVKKSDTVVGAMRVCAGCKASLKKGERVICTGCIYRRRMFTTYTCLDVSTAHITEHDNELMGEKRAADCPPGSVPDGLRHKRVCRRRL